MNLREQASSTIKVTNPKRHADSSLERRLFPYYAGYSTEFTIEALRSARLSNEAVILDPWNGAGTTTQAAQRLGYKAIGLDLNPAMVVVAKAGLLSPLEAPSLVPLAQSILEKSDEVAAVTADDDPLLRWLDQGGAKALRSLETIINRMLVSHTEYVALTTSGALQRVSPLAAFFYVALFRATRRLLNAFIATNPTWIKLPPTPQTRKRPRLKTIQEAFLLEVRTLTNYLRSKAVPSAEAPDVSILLGSSELIPLDADSVDFVLTSPPYCTRIDYAVATALELAVLRYSKSAFELLRRSLMGTSTVESAPPPPRVEWGKTCVTFLRKVREHPSKASAGYYYRSHLQYFGSLYNSMVDLRRVLRRDAPCVMVVQDSHYKDIHNDVPKIVKEMARSVGFTLRGEKGFVTDRSMVQMNTRAMKYLKAREQVETVLHFQNTAGG